MKNSDIGLFPRNPFGHLLFVKKGLIRVLGAISHRRYRGFNEIRIEGSEIIRALPDRNVLFVSNHQTYYADVAAMFHVFNASLKGREDNIKNVCYMWQPKLNIYYVAAKETMNSGLLPKIFAYAGAITVERTWRCEGKDVSREVNPDDKENIKLALEDGWVITFPQGTTKSFKPVRKGTAHIIMQHRPIVVPIVIDGFRRSFCKKGLHMKKKGVTQTFVIKEPLVIDYEKDSIDDIVGKVAFAIEQDSSFLRVRAVEEMEVYGVEAVCGDAN